MLGKLFGYLSFLQSLSVYQIKRYPTNKISIGGMILTYLATYYFIERLVLRNQIKTLNGESSRMCRILNRLSNFVKN